MPRTVQDIMNRELLAVRPGVPVREAANLLLSFQIGAAPVLGDDRRPLGVVALRDLAADAGAGATVAERMSRPAISVSIAASVELAARQMAAMDMHHLVVVDGAGLAVGMVSTLDALRALLDLPARHPHTFPHWDESTGTSWTDEWPLDADAVGHAPEGAGVLVLAAGRLGERDAVLWAEASEDMRERVHRLVKPAASGEPRLSKVLATPGLRFRAASVRDGEARERIVATLRQRIEATPAPGAT